MELAIAFAVGLLAGAAAMLVWWRVRLRALKATVRFWKGQAAFWQERHKSVVAYKDKPLDDKAGWLLSEYDARLREWGEP